MPISIYSEQITEIVNNVCSTMFSVSAEPVSFGLKPIDFSIDGEININGAWNGAVNVYCCEKTIHHIAMDIFQKELFTISGDDICDAMGEVINIIGGNLKSLLPTPSILSLPKVYIGSDRILKKQFESKNCTDILVGNEIMRVTVVEKNN